MHVADLEPGLVEIFGQVLGHALGQRGDQDAVAAAHRLPGLVDHVVDLAFDRPHLHRRVDQPGRADHLLGKHAAGAAHLPRARRRRHVDRLRAHRVPFVEAQRPVVDARRQAEAIFGERDLAAVVAPRHAADLRHGLVAFVHEQERILGQIFEQGRRRLARQPAGEEAGIILDAGTGAGGGDHLQVEIGALLQPLRLQQAAFRIELLQPLGQLEADRLGRLLHRRAGGDIVRIGINADIIQVGRGLAGQRIELDDLLDLVAEERHAPGRVLVVRREDFEVVAAHPKIAARERLVVALVLQRHQLADDLALVDRLALLQVEDHRRIGLDRADAVEARDRRHDQHVVPLQQRARGGVAHPVDRLVDRGLLLDIRVGTRHVGLGLVIVVIGDEELHRIVGKEALELAVELRRQDLVGREHQRRPLQMLHHLGHGEGLARAGDAQQHLVALALLRLRDELGDGGRLVAGRLVVGLQAEGLAAFKLVRPLGPVGHEHALHHRLGETRADLDAHGGNMEAGRASFQR